MMNFFKLYETYSKYIFKFWVNQISMSVFGVIVSLAAIVSQKTIFIIGAVLFSVGFLVFLQYDMMFHKGHEDSARNLENFKPNKLEGLKIGLLAYAPTILFGVICIVIYLCGLYEVSAILKFVLIFPLNGSFNAFFFLLSEVSYPVLIVISFIPVLAATTLGYYLGLKDKPIRKLLGLPVTPPKPNKNKTNKK